MKIGVIGAGISGLYAATMLKNQGFEVFVLEASSRAGGRIHTISDGNQHVAELGAELLYHPQGPLMKLLAKLRIPIQRRRGRDCYVYQGELLCADEEDMPPQLLACLHALDEVEQYCGDEMNLQQYFKRQVFYSDALKHVVNGFAGEYGASADQLGVRSLAIEESQWAGGDDEFYMQHPMELVVEFFLDQLDEDELYLSHPVKSVRLNADKIVVNIADESEFHCDLVLVSVSLGVLKSGDLQFVPDLPISKKMAIGSLGMSMGIKIVLKFSRQWWPDDIGVIEGGALSAEYLCSRNYADPTLTAFIMGACANKVMDIPQDQLAAQLCEELDALFGHQFASQSFVESFSKNWGQDIFCKGAYSYAAPFSAGMREALAEPVGGRMFFIGEACNTQGHAATIHGAMETAEQAVSRLLELVEVTA